MSRFSVFIAALALFGIMPLTTQAAVAGPLVVVPGGTILRVKPLDRISSADAHVGDTFEIETVDAVSVNGWVVIPQRAHGMAEVANVEPAGKHGVPGKLAVKYDWIYSADGGKIRLGAIRTNQTGESAKGSASTSTIVSTVLFGPIGLFAHNFVKGRNVTLDGSQTLEAVVENSVHVHAKERSDRGETFDR